MKKVLKYLKYILFSIVWATVIYGFTYIDYLLNKPHIQQLQSAHIALRFEDQILLGYGTFQWWAFVLTYGCAIVVTLVIALKE